MIPLIKNILMCQVEEHICLLRLSSQDCMALSKHCLGTGDDFSGTVVFMYGF